MVHERCWSNSTSVFFDFILWIDALIISWKIVLNSLIPRKFEWNFRYLISHIISVIDGRVTSCELALRWISLDLTDDKSTMVQVMAWCHQATSHYLSQCWPRSKSPYGVTRPQWVKWVPQNTTYMLTLVQVMAWCHQPLPEPMLTEVYVAIWYHNELSHSWTDRTDYNDMLPGIILCMRPANERRHYIVMSSLIGWAHTLVGLCFSLG